LDAANARRAAAVRLPQGVGDAGDEQGEAEQLRRGGRTGALKQLVQQGVVGDKVQQRQRGLRQGQPLRHAVDNVVQGDRPSQQARAQRTKAFKQTTYAATTG
jgi:hypothetical protein